MYVAKKMSRPFETNNCQAKAVPSKIYTVGSENNNDDVSNEGSISSYSDVNVINIQDTESDVEVHTFLLIQTVYNVHLVIAI